MTAPFPGWAHPFPRTLKFVSAFRGSVPVCANWKTKVFTPVTAHLVCLIRPHKKNKQCPAVSQFFKTIPLGKKQLDIEFSLEDG